LFVAWVRAFDVDDKSTVKENACKLFHSLHGKHVVSTHPSVLQIKNTYYIAPDANLPGPVNLASPDHSSARHQELPYYQWVPIILGFMILVIAIPGTKAMSSSTL